MRKKVAIRTGQLWSAPLCPTCSAQLDGFTGVDDLTSGKPPVPEPGSLTVCAYCRTVLAFEAAAIGLRLREATAEDWEGIPEEQVRIFQAVMRELEKEPPRPPPTKAKA
jgi:hypothetical protein